MDDKELYSHGAKHIYSKNIFFYTFIPCFSVISVFVPFMAVNKSTSQQVSTAHPFGLWAKVRIFVIFWSPHATTFGVRGYPPLAKARCIALQANAMVLESTSDHRAAFYFCAISAFLGIELYFSKMFKWQSIVMLMLQEKISGRHQSLTRIFYCNNSKRSETLNIYFL